MADLPIAPGQVYIEVEYDYEYTSKDRRINIKQGECYMLVKKANEDWWQVRKEDGSKPFYVPAQYVREVRKALMPPSKPLLHPPAASSNPPPQGGAALWVRPTTLDLQDRPGENLQRRESNTRRSPSAQTSSSGHISPPPHRRDSTSRYAPATPTDHDKALHDILIQGGGPQLVQRSSTLPRNRARSPDMARAPLDVDSTQLFDSAEEERRTNDSESGDELSSSSTEHLQTVSSSGQGCPESPVYTNLQELKISQASLPPQPSGSPLHVLGDWEMHRDQSGRHFYYNRSTQERTWKPPRARDASSLNSRGENHSAGESSEWLKHVDEQGRPYYYSADGSRSEWELPKPSEKCGVLNVTKITENGKKVRKNWTSSWTLLEGTTLLFTKGQGGSGWFGGQSKPEITVDLRGGSVDWASKDKSSKKHVLELKIRQGTELLIHSENDNVINDWYRALQETISTHAWESDEAIEEDLPESPGPEGHDKEKEHRDSKRARAMKTSTSMDSTENKKTRHKLKKFLTRRPTLQAVRDKGYIKDQVFGCSLSSLCQRENSTVPEFVMTCIDHVESSGLRVDGLYRVSGNLAIIQKLRYAVNHDEKVNLVEGKWEDVHVTTGALKMFFRELPEPLFTFKFFHDFINAIKMSEYKQRVQSIRDLVKQLPRANHDTMQVLFKHLRKVVDHGEENRMTTHSLAIVFGPTLLRPETETLNMAIHMVYQNQIVELILVEYENIFGR
ncbi:rho GTPase-activating protein 12-like isoform X8 [Cynoglossus semilaevis]|uniref:rho GTPase-activating protein 12-like isoform X8 n=1 Tax=Cynoglossus semilaevis TaxID=244447 RepID=UPI000D62F866|nr:rho GTPase-activating protein 12-like isoform X8 [Cynoglossus semilaevis]